MSREEEGVCQGGEYGEGELAVWLGGWHISGRGCWVEFGN